MCEARVVATRQRAIGRYVLYALHELGVDRSVAIAIANLRGSHTERDKALTGPSGRSGMYVRCTGEHVLWHCALTTGMCIHRTG